MSDEWIRDRDWTYSLRVDGDGAKFVSCRLEG